MKTLRVGTLIDTLVVRESPLSQLLRHCGLVLALGLLCALPTYAEEPPASPEGLDANTTSEGTPKKPTPSLEEEPDLPGGLRDLEEEYGVLISGPAFEQVARIAALMLLAAGEECAQQIKAVRVLDSEIENAFATPDGHIYVFRGLVDSMATDDQLAGVMGHEFTHVWEGHGKQLSKDWMKYQIAAVAALALTGEAGLAVAAQMIGDAKLLAYSEAAELEADAGGLELLARAGYEPSGMLEFMAQLNEEAKIHPMMTQGYFLTHPYPAERMAKIKAWMVGRGFEIPTILFKARLPVDIVEIMSADGEVRGSIALVVDETTLLELAGTPETARARAEVAAAALTEALAAGARDYDFVVNPTGADYLLSARGIAILVITPADAALTGETAETLAATVRDTLRQLVWRELRERQI